MANSRYTQTSVLGFGSQLGTGRSHEVIRAAIAQGTLATTQYIIQEGTRLDVLAGSLYGEARYWWILAAASDIGWGLQVPPGTVVNVPDLNAVLGLVG